MEKIKIREDLKHRTLGKKVFELETPWKISALAELPGGVMIGAYHNDTRRDSQIYWNGKLVTRLVDGKETPGFNAETIGQPLVVGKYAAAAGECGHLIVAVDGRIFEHMQVRLDWASTCVLFNSAAYVLDWTGREIAARDCVTGHTRFVMPGKGIPLAAAEYCGLLFAAVADSETGEHGLANSEGRLWKAPACQCVLPAWGRLLYSSWNKIFAFTGNEPEFLGELPCEKIMDMRMTPWGELRIAGANPDTVWEANIHGRVYTIGSIQTGNASVGGSCFRVRVSQNYFARCRDGHTGEVYEIIPT